MYSYVRDLAVESPESLERSMCVFSILYVCMYVCTYVCMHVVVGAERHEDTSDLTDILRIHL